MVAPADMLLLADRAFASGNYDEALELSERLAQSSHDPKAYFTCGLIYEHGSSKRGQDLAKAYQFFDRLRIEWDSSEGDVGCARIIVNSRDVARIDAARKFCESAIDRDDFCYAHLILGRIQGEFLGMHREARRSFLRAAFKGSAWAMRLYASSLMRTKSRLGGAMAHVLVTILSPVYLLLGGLSATRRG